MVCFSIDRGLPEAEDSFPAGEIGAGQDAHIGRCVRLEMLLHLNPHSHCFHPCTTHVLSSLFFITPVSVDSVSQSLNAVKTAVLWATTPGFWEFPKEHSHILLGWLPFFYGHVVALDLIKPRYEILSSNAVLKCVYFLFSFIPSSIHPSIHSLTQYLQEHL